MISNTQKKQTEVEWLTIIVVFSILSMFIISVYQDHIITAYSFEINAQLNKEQAELCGAYNNVDTNSLPSEFAELNCQNKNQSSSFVTKPAIWGW